ncbi:MAG: hypothetical protein ACO3A5_08060 [Bacteroidia bacterium]
MKKATILLIFTLSSALSLIGQVEDDPDTGASIPVDGGIIAVTGLAFAYGLYRKKKQS